MEEYNDLNNGLGDQRAEENNKFDGTSSTGTSEEEATNMSFSAKVYDVFFNVLFLMIHGNNPNPILEYLTFIIEDFQLISFAYHYKLKVNMLPEWIQDIFDILEYYGEDFNYEKYKVLFALSAFAVVILVLNLAYIFYGCWRGHYEYIWPIRLVRFLAIILPTVLFIPIVAALLASLDCTYGDAKPKLASFSTPSHEILCFSGSHLPLYILGIVLSAFFIVISWTFNLFFLENNPTLKRPIAKLHGRVDLYYCVMKTILVILWKFGWSKGVTNNTLNAVVITGYTVLISAAMCYLMLWYFPFFSPTINHVRFGFYFTSTTVNLVSFLFTLAAYLKVVDETPTTVSLLLGLLVPSYVAGYVISSKYYQYVIAVVDQDLKTFKANEASGSNGTQLVFSRWPLVEISCRFILRQTDSRIKYIDLDNDWEPFTQKFDQGLKEFPTKHFVALSYGLYLNQMATAAMADLIATNLDVKQSLTVLLHKSAKTINKCKKQKPEWDVAFQIFYMERALSQRREVDELGDGIKMDVASYADFKKKEKVASNNHQQVIRNLMNAWRLIITKDYDSQQLAAYCRGAYEANIRANDAYNELIRKFPKSQNILRQYAKFLMEAGNQPYRAKMILMRADALEEEAAQASGHKRKGFNTAVKESAKLDDRQKALLRNDSSSMKSDGKSDGEDNHNDRKSDHSGSSATTNIELRAENLYKSIRMRLTEKANKMVQILNINNIIIVLLTIGVILVNYFVVTNVLSLEAFYLKYYHKLFDREFLTGYEFLAARKLHHAVSYADEKEFAFYTKRLKETAHKMGEVNEYLLENRNKDNAEVSAVYTTRIKEASFSFFPESEEKRYEKVSVYDFLDLFEVLGIKLANLEFGGFGLNQTGAKWLETNNDFRFIMDNADKVQYTYNEAVKAFTVDAETTAASSSIAYTLTAIQLSTVFLLLLFVDYLVSSFYQRQGNSLNLFRLIPTKKVKEILNAMIEQQNGENGEGGNDSAVDIETVSESSGGLLSGMNRFRVRYVLFFIILSILSVVFAVFNGSHIDYLGRNFAVMVAFGDCRSFGTMTAALINEIAVQDMDTWGSDEFLRKHFIEVALNLEHASENLLYGDQLAHPPGFGIDEFPTSIKNLFKNPGCVTNITRCEDKSRYSVNYGLTEDLLLGGLEKLFRSVMTKIYTVIIQAEEEFIPDYKLLRFFDELFDYDYVDGLTRGIDDLELQAQNYAEQSVFDDTIQLIIILVFVSISYFVVFVYMASELKLRNYQIAELFIYLPQDLVKTIPELSNYLRTGEIDRGVIEQINAARDKYKLGNANKEIKNNDAKEGGKDKDVKEEAKKEAKKPFSFFKSKEKPVSGSLLKPDESDAKGKDLGSNVKLDETTKKN